MKLGVPTNWSTSTESYSPAKILAPRFNWEIKIIDGLPKVSVGEIPLEPNAKANLSPFWSATITESPKEPLPGWKATQKP
jgi:hypothetical protein